MAAHDLKAKKHRWFHFQVFRTILTNFASFQGGPVGAPVQSEDGTWMGQVANSPIDISWKVSTYLNISWQISKYCDKSQHIFANLDLTYQDKSWDTLTTLELGFSKPGPSGLSPRLGISRPHRPAHHQTEGFSLLKCSPHLKVNQVEALEAIAGVMGVGFETSNKYKIKNSLGQVGASVIYLCIPIWIFGGFFETLLCRLSNSVPFRTCTKRKRIQSVALGWSADPIGLLTCRYLIMQSER